MDVKPWRDTLDAMTQPGGWIGRRDKKADKAYAVLAGYEKQVGWIKHSIPAERVDRSDGTVQAIGPQESVDAEAQRDAILQLALLHELSDWAAHRRGHELDVVELARAIVRAAMVAPTGLRAKAVEQHASKPYTPVDFAHSKSAKGFFEDVVRKKLLLLDAKMKSLELASHVPHVYDVHDESTIEQWGRAWTAGVATVALDLIVNIRPCRAVEDVARTIWRDSWSSCHFEPALVPVDKTARTVHIELRTRAAVAYALAGSEAIRGLPAGEPVSLPFQLRAFTEARGVGGKKLYDAYNRTHLYLTVWLDCLHGANGTPAMPEHKPSPTETAGGDAVTFDALAPEQRAALAQTVTARRNLAAISKAMTGARRLSPIRKASPSIASSGADSMTGTEFDWEPMSQRSLRPLASDAEPGTRWQPIASIDIWRELGAEVSWIDLLVVARVNDRQVPLPVTMEDDVFDDDASKRSLLLLDEGARPAVSSDALRRAFATDGAVVGVVVRKSLGAFVVLELDMNAQSEGGRGV